MVIEATRGPEANHGTLGRTCLEVKFRSAGAVLQFGPGVHFFFVLKAQVSRPSKFDPMLLAGRQSCAGARDSESRRVLLQGCCRPRLRVAQGTAGCCRRPRLRHVHVPFRGRVAQSRCRQLAPSRTPV